MQFLQRAYFPAASWILVCILNAQHVGSQHACWNLRSSREALRAMKASLSIAETTSRLKDVLRLRHPRDSTHDWCRALALACRAYQCTTAQQPADLTVLTTARHEP